VSPLRGENPIFGPVSKNNTGMAALRADLPVINTNNTNTTNIIIIIINDSIYPAVSKASRTGNKVSCQPNDCPNR